jgi:F420-dependent oxidoreductase-like protein
MGRLKLGLQLGYWGAQPPAGSLQAAQEAEKLGFDAVFTAEAWGSDCFTPLTWIAAHTSRIRVGTAICQIAARTPASTAMHALTLDHLSQGRMILGLGVSGPQVVEGWYGQPFAKPVSRTREYVEIIRAVLRRDAPVTSPGPHYPLPYTGPGSWGLGKPLRAITHPLRADMPIWLGAEGPRNVALAAEAFDGWLPLWYSPWREDVYREALRAAKPGFEIAQTCTVLPTDDVPGAIARLKPAYGFYVGGMGARDRNFHKELMARLGWEAEAQQIQDLFLAGRRDEANAAVPDAFVDELNLIGPRERIRERLAAWQASAVTMLLVSGSDPAQLRTAAELVLGA